jgi:hypothetical protein
MGVLALAFALWVKPTKQHKHNWNMSSLEIGMGLVSIMGILFIIIDQMTSKKVHN